MSEIAFTYLEFELFVGMSRSIENLFILFLHKNWLCSLFML